MLILSIYIYGISYRAMYTYDYNDSLQLNAMLLNEFNEANK